MNVFKEDVEVNYSYKFTDNLKYKSFITFDNIIN